MEPTLSFTAPPTRCEYLPHRLARLRYELIPALQPADYMARLRQGWRRFGPVVFHPECPSCQACQSLRVPVAAFRSNQSQRRAWRQNQAEVTVQIGTPSPSPEKEDLFARFHQFQHEAKGWPADGSDGRMFFDNPFPTEEWCYSVGDRLIGVGYVDVLAEGLSAIYFYYDPGERHRSLGTYNVLSILAAARERNLPHVYLGYYVAGCRSLEYKAKFTPNEILTPQGRWIPFEPKLASEP